MSAPTKVARASAVERGRRAVKTLRFQSRRQLFGATLHEGDGSHHLLLLRARAADRALPASCGSPPLPRQLWPSDWLNIG